LSGRTKFTWKQRLEAVEMCLSGNYSYTEVAKKFNTKDSTLRNWINSYKNNGVDGLQKSHTWRKYSLELKLAATDSSYQSVFHTPSSVSHEHIRTTEYPASHTLAVPSI